MSGRVTFAHVELSRRLKAVSIGRAVAEDRAADARKTKDIQLASRRLDHPPAPPKPSPAQPDQNTELMELLKELGLAVEDLHGKQRQSLAELQAVTIQLALSAASWLTGVSLSQDQFDLAGLVSRAINHIGLAETPSISLHPRDRELLLERVADKARWLDQIRLSSDPTLPRGSCRVENSKHAKISTVSERLEEVHRIWNEELENAQTERRTSPAGDRGIQRVPDRRDTA